VLLPLLPPHIFGSCADSPHAFGFLWCAQARNELFELQSAGGMVQGRMSMTSAAHDNWRQDCIAWCAQPPFTFAATEPFLRATLLPARAAQLPQAAT